MASVYGDPQGNWTGLNIYGVLCMSVKLFELFAFREKEKKEKCKKSKAGVFYGSTLQMLSVVIAE